MAKLGAPDLISGDRWREAELRDSLTVAAVPPCELDFRGQGFKDGGEDVRDMRRACAEDSSDASTIQAHAQVTGRCADRDGRGGQLETGEAWRRRTARRRPRMMPWPLRSWPLLRVIEQGGTAKPRAAAAAWCTSRYEHADRTRARSTARSDGGPFATGR